ncbi:hypothetical protein FHL15_007139 [Xylaria flabelliformis]|uniref:Uncharacterized protein n=1 Tax=Xylaria flabelliformis TaxID=2512241 RepID=A0A553HVR6_9PEZI|nr:hypothetical protein FHL15_007139 [Xylaria flabelliformis]
METGESGARQSAFTSAARSEPYTHSRLEARNRHFHEPPTMAAAALLNPATGYHAHSQTFSSPYHQPGPPPVATTMMPPGDSKRLSNEVENVPRQSLPSLAEVFPAGKPSHHAPTTPTTLATSQNLPPPFVSVGPPPQQRPEPGPEPRPLPTHEEKYFRYPSRHDSGPSQGAGSQSSFSFSEHNDMSKAPDPAPSSNHMSSQPPPSIPYPPGQLPLSAASAAPRHHGPFPPYDSHRPPPPRADEEYGMQRTRYDTTLNRHFEAWGYTDCLGKIAWNANTLRNFAEAYMKVASEQHGGQPIPERLPTEKEVSDLIDVTMWLKSQLENVRDIVQHSLAEKARDSRNSGPSYEGDDDISMYGDSVKPSSYGLGEVKKRRGIRLNGDEGRTAQGRYAMHVAYTMLNSSENDKWNKDPFAQKPWRRDLDTPSVASFPLHC